MKKTVAHTVIIGGLLVGSLGCASTEKPRTVSTRDAIEPAQTAEPRSETDQKIDRRLEEIRQENYGKFRINSLFKK